MRDKRNMNNEALAFIGFVAVIAGFILWFRNCY